jgi:hypothetical protein
MYLVNAKVVMLLATYTSLGVWLMRWLCALNSPDCHRTVSAAAKRTAAAGGLVQWTRCFCPERKSIRWRD